MYFRKIEPDEEVQRRDEQVRQEGGVRRVIEAVTDLDQGLLMPDVQVGAELHPIQAAGDLDQDHFRPGGLGRDLQGATHPGVQPQQTRTIMRTRPPPCPPHQARNSAVGTTMKKASVLKVTSANSIMVTML